MNVLLVDGNDDVIVIKHVIASGPTLDRVVIDSIATLRVLGKCLKEVCIEEIHLGYRYFELIVKVSDVVSESCVFQIVTYKR